MIADDSDVGTCRICRHMIVGNISMIPLSGCFNTQVDNNVVFAKPATIPLMETAARLLYKHMNWTTYSAYAITFAIALTTGAPISDFVHVINNNFNLHVVQEVLSLVTPNIIIQMIDQSVSARFFIKWCLRVHPSIVAEFVSHVPQFTPTTSRDIFNILVFGSYYLQKPAISKLLNHLTYPSTENEWVSFIGYFDMSYMPKYVKVMHLLPVDTQRTLAQCLLKNHLRFAQCPSINKVKYTGPVTRNHHKRINNFRWKQEIKHNIMGTGSEFIHSGYVSCFIQWMNEDQLLKIWENMYLQMSCIAYCNEVCDECTFTYTCNLHRRPIIIFPVCLEFWDTTTMKTTVSRIAHRLCFENNKRVETILFLTKFINLNECLDKRKRYDDNYNCCAALVYVLRLQQRILVDSFDQHVTTTVFDIGKRCNTNKFTSVAEFNQMFMTDLCYAKKFISNTAIMYLSQQFQCTVNETDILRKMFNVNILPYQNTKVDVNGVLYVFNWQVVSGYKYLKCIGHI